METRRIAFTVALLCLVLHGLCAVGRAQFDRIVAADSDTVFVFGGPGSLEGRFETADGRPDWQGWVSSDATDRPHWQTSTFNAANLSGTANNHAMWAGRTSVQEPDWATAPGYGTNRRDWLYWTREVQDTSAATQVRLSFVFNHDTEIGSDFFTVAWDSAGTWIDLLRLDGSNRTSGGSFEEPVVFDRTVVYAPGGYGGLGADRIRLRLLVLTDGTGSDRGGDFDSDGAVQVDDIAVRIDGALVSFADFEPEGSDGGWIAHDGHANGDLTKILAGFDDAGLDPDRDNPTPALTIVDDGTPPPNLPDAVPTNGATSDWDYGFPGFFVVDPNEWVQVSVVSPAIELDSSLVADPARDQAVIRVDVWDHGPDFQQYVYLWLYARASSTAGASDWADWEVVGSLRLTSSDPSWRTVAFPWDGLAASRPDSVQIGIGLGNVCLSYGCLTSLASPSPVVDNVSLALASSSAVSAPAAPRELVYHGSRPNPFNPRTEIEFAIARKAFVTLDVFDVSGGLVRRLVHAVMPAGVQSVVWDGTDDRGGDVASGVYFVRVSALGVEVGSKIVLVR